MAIVLSSPKYSFIQFIVSNIPITCDVPMPITLENDIKFQIIVNTDTSIEADNIMANDHYLYAVKYRSVIISQKDLMNNMFLDFHNTNNQFVFIKTRISTTRIVLYWSHQLIGISSFRDRLCFQFAIALNNSPEITQYFTSNIFFKTNNTTYTSMLEYTNEEDYGNFYYCKVPNAVNKIRLPFYLTHPKPIEDKAIYRKSGGGIIQTRSIITKEFQVFTENFPEQIHDKITVMLGHDIINVVSDIYTGGITKSGEYTIEWTDNIEYATANFKATATPYAIKNSNCNDCDDSNITPECGIIKNITGTTIL